MRIKVRLKTVNKNTRLPINYNFGLQAIIYRLLDNSSSKYAEFLHDLGYKLGDKKFKLFTFSQLFSSKRKVDGNIVMFQSDRVEWLVSSPIEDFVLHFIQGLLALGTVQIYSEPFLIQEVQMLPEPEFASEMNFTCLSPITISTVEGEGEGRRIHFLRYDEEKFVQNIKQNLTRKYQTLTSLNLKLETPEPLNLSEDFKFTFDSDYITRKSGSISKLVEFKETKIKSYLAPFRVQGDPRLIRTGYECGFGDRNSAGFGMVEAAKRL